MLFPATQIPRIPQIGAPEASQQTIELVAGCICPGPRARAITLPSIPQSTPMPAPGQRYYKNSLIHQFAAFHAESIILNSDNLDVAQTRKFYIRELKLAAIQYTRSTCNGGELLRPKGRRT
jgi:hypothetical protein